MGKTLSEKRAAAGKKGGSTTWARLRAEGKVAPPPPPQPTVAELIGKPEKVDESDPQAVIVASIKRLRAYFEVCPPEERAKVSGAITSATNLYAKLTGSLEVSQVQLLRSRAWREARDVLYHALKPYPEAAKAVAAAFEAWEKR